MNRARKRDEITDELRKYTNHTKEICRLPCSCFVWLVTTIREANFRFGASILWRAWEAYFVVNHPARASCA
jgi:hypothetical protein